MLVEWNGPRCGKPTILPSPPENWSFLQWSGFKCGTEIISPHEALASPGENVTKYVSHFEPQSNSHSCCTVVTEGFT